VNPLAYFYGQQLQPEGGNAFCQIYFSWPWIVPSDPQRNENSPITAKLLQQNMQTDW